MDFSSLTVFGVVKKRLAWLTQRQEVLAQNISNADTPGYVPKDLDRFEFKDVLRREANHLNMNVSSAGHLGGSRKRMRDFMTRTERRPFETLAAGNAVVLEEQMGKINESQVAHKLTTELYKKQLRMFKIAIGKG